MNNDHSEFVKNVIKARNIALKRLINEKALHNEKIYFHENGKNISVYAKDLLKKKI